MKYPSAYNFDTDADYYDAIEEWDELRREEANAAEEKWESERDNR